MTRGTRLGYIQSSRLTPIWGWAAKTQTMSRSTSSDYPNNVVNSRSKFNGVVGGRVGLGQEYTGWKESPGTTEYLLQPA